MIILCHISDCDNSIQIFTYCIKGIKIRFDHTKSNECLVIAIDVSG